MPHDLTRCTLFCFTAFHCFESSTHVCHPCFVQAEAERAQSDTNGGESAQHHVAQKTDTPGSSAEEALPPSAADGIRSPGMTLKRSRPSSPPQDGGDTSRKKHNAFSVPSDGLSQKHPPPSPFQPSTISSLKTHTNPPQPQFRPGHTCAQTHAHAHMGDMHTRSHARARTDAHARIHTHTHTQS